MSFLPSIIRDGHSSLNQFIGKALTIYKYVCHDPEILAALNILEGYHFCILENIDKVNLMGEVLEKIMGIKNDGCGLNYRSGEGLSCPAFSGVLCNGS